MSLSIKDSLTPALRMLAIAVADKRPVLEAMGTKMESITKRSFRDASLRAAPWRPLKKATIMQKIRAGKSTGLLMRDTVLMKAWRTDVTRSTVTVSTDRSYAPYLQFGTKRGIPARPMLPFIGGPDSSQLAPWAHEKIQQIAKQKLAKLIGAR